MRARHLRPRTPRQRNRCLSSARIRTGVDAPRRRNTAGSNMAGYRQMSPCSSDESLPDLLPVTASCDVFDWAAMLPARRSCGADSCRSQCLRSNCHTRDTPPRPRVTWSIAATRGVGPPSATAPHATSRNGPAVLPTDGLVLPQPHDAGGSGNSTQSHWVSSPGRCSMTALRRSVALRQAAQLPPLHHGAARQRGETVDRCRVAADRLW